MISPFFAVLDTPSITGALALLDLALAAATVVWVLTIKREPTSALAWCLLVVFLPIIGSLLFVLLGYQSIHVPLRRKRRHASEYRGRGPAPRRAPPARG
jgi:cardiolipin synthase